MADFENQNRDFLLLHIANEAIVADAISPWSALLAQQSFSPLPGIIAAREASPQEALDRLSGAGPASLVTCLSAVRVTSIRQRSVGKLLTWREQPPFSSGSRRIPSMFNRACSTGHVQQGQRRPDRISRSD
jgi:hypothetical protein